MGEVWREYLISMQDYKSPSSVVIICVTLVNTHTHTDRQTDRQILTSYTISSASSAKNTCKHTYSLNLNKQDLILS